MAFRSVGTYTSATSGTLSPPIPAGIANNDILICVVGTGANPTITMPAGWTLKSTWQNGTANQLQVWWKRTTGTESAPAVAGATQDVSAFIAAYSGETTSGDPIEVAGTGNSGTTSPATALSITPLTNGDDVLYVGLWTTTGAATQTWGTPSGSAPGFTVRQQNTFQGGTVNVSVMLADGAQATAAATGNRTSSLTANDNWVAAMVALAPPGGGGAAVQQRLMLLGMGS